MGNIIWQQRPSRHFRRYSQPDKYPYIVRWGNPRLTTSAKMRSYWGARLVSMLWIMIGRGGVYIEKREG